ncbi:hypothetical protein GGX14DRAFT_656086 [Mycena pura]|uniref:Uncharacterized protein n=1 Tax=Mycena pura TaxID=153505 RepID=A0AAD6V2P9_9AGAR|nr:hypothetical protein GGX14DRAFT_656086 [Mycena pura]
MSLKNWSVWKRGSPAELTFTRINPNDPAHAKLFQSLNDVRLWLILNPHAMRTITTLTFDTDVAATSRIFMEREKSITAWLCHEPPEIYFEPLPCIGCTQRPPRTITDRKRTTKITLALSLLTAMSQLEAAIQRGDGQPFLKSKLMIVVFVLQRTLLHELAHAARSIFATGPSPTGLVEAHKQTNTPSGIETHEGRDLYGRAVKRGEIGWEMEARTGGEVHLRRSGVTGLQDLDGSAIIGMTMQVSKTLVRHVALERELTRRPAVREETLLTKLASANWDNIDADLASMPSTAAFQYYGSALRSADFAVPCGLWNHEQDGDEQEGICTQDGKGDKPGEPHQDNWLPDSPCPSSGTWDPFVDLSLVHDDDGSRPPEFTQFLLDEARVLVSLLRKHTQSSQQNNTNEPRNFLAIGSRCQWIFCAAVTSVTALSVSDAFEPVLLPRRVDVLQHKRRDARVLNAFRQDYCSTFPRYPIAQRAPAG